MTRLFCVDISNVFMALLTKSTARTGSTLRVFAAFSVLSTAAIAQISVPETPAGKALTEDFAALTSGDEAHLGAFFEHYHCGGTLEGLSNFARGTGGFSVLRVEQSEENSITVLAAERNSDNVALVTLTLTADAAAKTTKCSLQFRVTERPTELALAIPRMTHAGALAAMKERATSLSKDDKFSGAYLVAQDGKVLAAHTFGWEDRESKVPVTLNTKFRIGSINKIFTAVAVLQLIDAGKIEMDGKVGDYLPNYPNKDVATKVTVRQLLTMTGGTGDIFGAKYDANRLGLKTHADYVALFGSRGLDFEPGSKDSYSNYGYVLLGRIIEQVSGESYYDFVERHVFAPAGMHDTASTPEDQVVPKRAVAYTWKGNGWTPVQDLPYRGSAGGGGYTTIGDMLKFARALQAEKLLPGRLLADATTPHDHGGRTGYGFELSGKGFLQSYGKNGGAPGQNGQFRVYPALHRVVVVFSNFDPNVADNLATFYALRMPASP